MCINEVLDGYVDLECEGWAEMEVMRVKTLEVTQEVM